jgi:hypothetical protein
VLGPFFGQDVVDTANRGGDEEVVELMQSVALLGVSTYIPVKEDIAVEVTSK